MDGPEDSLTEYDAEEDTGKGNYEKKILPHEFSGVGGHLTGTLRGRHVLAIHLGEQVLGEPSRGLLLHFTRPPVSGVDGGGGGGAGRARGGRSSGRSPRRFCQVPFSRSLAVNGGAPATPQRPRVAVLGVFRKIRAERAITTRSHRTFQQAAALPRALRRGDPTDIRIRFDVVPSQRCHRSMIALLPSRYPPRVTLSLSSRGFRTLPAISSTGFARSSSRYLLSRQSLTRAPNVWKKGAIDVAASEVTGLFELIQPERSRCCTGSVTFPSGSTLHLEPIYSRLPGVMMHRIFSRDVVFPS